MDIQPETIGRDGLFVLVFVFMLSFSWRVSSRIFFLLVPAAQMNQEFRKIQTLTSSLINYKLFSIVVCIQLTQLKSKTELRKG